MRTRALTPKLWPALETLFGSNGACGGCWCMFWHQPLGISWGELKGAPAKRQFKRRVKEGRSLGVLAFSGDEPIGWCAFGPRPSFCKLDRSPSFACRDADRVWSIPCFFVKAGRRGQGVARALLAGALAALKRRGAKIVEGYPVRPKGRYPAAFAYTGTLSLFESMGFSIVEDRKGGRVRVRREL